MAKQRVYELSEVDEVERMRQVRRELEQQFDTADEFFDWLEKLQRQHDARKRRAARKGSRQPAK